MSDPYAIPLRADRTYHIFNQGNNREDIFIEPRNYLYFLDKIRDHISPIAQIFAYCLLPNHFHLLVRVYSYDVLYERMPGRFLKPIFHSTYRESTQPDEAAFDDRISQILARQFSNLFSGYAQAFNKANDRKGKLFSLPFGRVLIEGQDLFTYLICYIHRNPVHHRFCDDYGIWPYSSYQEILEKLKSSQEIGTPTAKTHLIDNGTMPSSILYLEFLELWFGKTKHYLMLHEQAKEKLERKFLLE
ncbi:MAG: hypothetical protein IPM82_01450 [Saprospiraceae bacterium]|nr:hypothetical protein [Saprospiraceae bacterium]